MNLSQGCDVLHIRSQQEARNSTQSLRVVDTAAANDEQHLLSVLFNA